MKWGSPWQSQGRPTGEVGISAVQALERNATVGRTAAETLAALSDKENR